MNKYAKDHYTEELPASEKLPDAATYYAELEKELNPHDGSSEEATDAATEFFHKKQFEQLIDQVECNTLEECVAFFAKLAEDDPKLEMKELKIDFQRYLNEQARRLRRSANKEIHTELLVGLSLKEWDGSDNLIDEDGQIGTRTVQLLKNIRVGRYLKEYGESLFSREAKEVFSGGYAVFYQIGTITSVSDIQKVLERAKTVTGENYEIVGFQRWLNKEAEKYALEGVNVDGKISDREVELIQQLRLQKTISASKDYDGYATRRWKHYRLDRDEDLYVDDKDIQWDSLERQLKDIDRGVTIEEARKRIQNGEFGKQSGDLRDKVVERTNHVWKIRLLKQAAESTGVGVKIARKKYEQAKKQFRITIQQHPAVNDRFKGRYMTYCIRSMRENFEKLGIDIRSDYPQCVEYDPAFRRDVVTGDLLSQDANKQLAYFADKPEYFRGYPLKGVPEQDLKKYCRYLQDQLYKVFYDYPTRHDTHGVACPILHDRTAAGHGSICYLDSNGTIKVADSYYMPDGRSGPFEEYIRTVRKKMQGGKQTEGVILLPTFAYEKHQ